MSYAFQVRKRDGKLEVVTDNGTNFEQLLKQIPDDALYVISGHTPGPDTSSVGHIQVNLMTAAGAGTPHVFVGSAAGSYNTKET